ncbi:unnamed protein product [Phaeothamnion confervicola]
MRVLIGGALCALASLAEAQEFSAICKFERSEDYGRAVQAPIGEMSISITYKSANPPQNVIIKTTKPPCLDFVGDGDELKVSGVCTQFPTSDSGRYKYTIAFTFDRLTGAFQQLVQQNDVGRLIHHGRCTPATRVF